MKVFLIGIVFVSLLVIGCVSNVSAPSASPSVLASSTPVASVQAAVDVNSVESSINAISSDLNDTTSSIEEVEIGALNDSELGQIT